MSRVKVFCLKMRIKELLQTELLCAVFYLAINSSKLLILIRIAVQFMEEMCN